MVSSLQNKSRDEVLAEFDALFGGYNLSLQNPTTYRRKDNHLLILPSEVKISDVIAALGRLLGERYLLILSHLYFSGLLFKQQSGQLGNFIAVHRDTLRRLGGERYLQLLDYGLAEKHLIKSPRKYIVGKQSNEYRLDQKTFSLEFQQRYELTSKTATRVRTEQFHTNKNKFVRTHAVYRKIAGSVDGLTFDYTNAMRFASALKGSKLESCRNAIERILLGPMPWLIDLQRRNYTIIVNVPKEVRRYFSYGKEPLYAVDVSACHPLLHVLVYTADSVEKQRYQSIVEGGKFWEFMNVAAGKPFNLLVEGDKDELKKTVNREVFYSYPEPKGGATKLFAVTFKREFPILWSEIDRCKVRNSFKAAGPISRIMLETESEAVLDAVELLLKKPYPLITIHDAVVTTKLGLADVKQALSRSFSQLQLKPRLVEKQLTV